MIIFSCTGSPQVKILQKVLGGLLFLTHTVAGYRRRTAGKRFCDLDLWPRDLLSVITVTSTWLWLIVNSFIKSIPNV